MRLNAAIRKEVANRFVNLGSKKADTTLPKPSNETVARWVKKAYDQQFTKQEQAVLAMMPEAWVYVTTNVIVLRNKDDSSYFRDSRGNLIASKPTIKLSEYGLQPYRSVAANRFSVITVGDEFDTYWVDRERSSEDPAKLWIDRLGMFSKVNEALEVYPELKPTFEEVIGVKL